MLPPDAAKVERTQQLARELQMGIKEMEKRLEELKDMQDPAPLDKCEIFYEQLAAQTQSGIDRLIDMLSSLRRSAAYSAPEPPTGVMIMVPGRGAEINWLLNLLMGVRAAEQQLQTALQAR